MTDRIPRSEFTNEQKLALDTYYIMPDKKGNNTYKKEQYIQLTIYEMIQYLDIMTAEGYTAESYKTGKTEIKLARKRMLNDFVNEHTEKTFMISTPRVSKAPSWKDTLMTILTELAELGVTPTNCFKIFKSADNDEVIATLKGLKHSAKATLALSEYFGTEF